MKIIEIPLKSRNCECCGGTDLELVWSNQSIVAKTSSRYLFKVATVICKKCGFCFSSPVYHHEFLSQYYADGFSRCKEIMLPYSIDRRLAFLKKYSVPDGILAEIGGDQADDFHAALNGFFNRIVNVEVTSDAGAEFDDIDGLPSDFADVIVHYDVLEHVPNIADFLATCHKVLKKDGLMICEVPDIRLYPRNLLLLEYEHVNHFSPLTLASIAGKSGFELLEVGHPCSRPYGFAAAFRKVEHSAGRRNHEFPSELMEARSYIQGAVRQIEYVHEKMDVIRRKIDHLANEGRKIAIWCVTDLLYRLIENYALPETAVVIDTDPRRETHLESYGLKVRRPGDGIDHLKNSDLLVICAPRYQNEILEWIDVHAEKRFAADELEVLGTGTSGESLN